MTVDRTKLNYYSGDPIDKVVGGDIISFSNDGNTGANSEIAKIQTDTRVNPYGKKCFVRFKWSIDGGVNFNSSDTLLLYSFTIHINDTGVTSSPVQGLQAAVSCGASDGLLYFVTGNGYHGNVTRATGAAPDVYTPTPQTFTIKYELIEILP